MSQLPKQIDPYWKILEEDRISILAAIARLESDQITRKPDQDSWCILEVIEHLKRVDGQILKVVQQSTCSQSISWRDKIYYHGLLIAMEIPFRFRAPRSTTPKEIPVSLDLLATTWSQIRKDWFEYLKKAPNEAMDYGVFSHPRAGALTLPQTLKWMGRHQNRHFRQIKRLISLVNTP